MIPPSPASEEVLVLEHRRTTAMVAADVATLDALILDGCRYIHSSGVIDTKETYLEKLRSGASRYLRIEASDQRVLHLGETAIVTSILSFDVASDGNTRSLRIHATAVWQRTEAGTRLAFFQATVAPPPD